MENKIKYSKLKIKEEKEKNIIAIDKTRFVENRISFKARLKTVKAGLKIYEQRGGKKRK